MEVKFIKNLNHLGQPVWDLVSDKKNISGMFTIRRNIVNNRYKIWNNRHSEHIIYNDFRTLAEAKKMVIKLINN